MINKELAKKQNLTDNQILAIEEIHKQLARILKRPTMYMDEKDVARVIESLETTLQVLWGFPVDRNFHRYWFLVEGCLCSPLENSERVGTPYRVINKDCPFHGDKDE